MFGRLVRWGIGLGLVVLLLLVPFLLWVTSQPKEFHVAILDKSVPDNSYREHKGLVWLLNHYKYRKSDGMAYKLQEDYYGYFPGSGSSYTTKDLDETLQEHDLLYITDSYGVYEQDLSGDKEEGNRSDRIYGGLTETDLDQIKRYVYKGMPLIAEFNTFGSPTNQQVRSSMYKLLGLQWSGWIGRSFDDLSIGGEVPLWAMENYKAQTGLPWEFTGAGFLFVNEDDHVVVLSGKNETGDRGTRFIMTEEGKHLVGGKKLDTRYNYWFDIVEAKDSSKVLANYRLDVTEAGVAKLNEAGIPTEFPAVIKQDNGVYTSYYFAGDYADSDEIPSLYRIKGLAGLMSLFSWETSEGSQTFYWKAYLPMMKGILGELYDSKLSPSTDTAKETTALDGVQLVARTQGMKLQVFQGGDWKDFFSKGVNMGMAVPGKWFTELPTDEKDYLRWLEQIGAMNSNTIRVYTLMDPSFYRALLAYNTLHPDKPLMLMQEIWPEEHPKNHDFLNEAYNVAYHEEIRYVIDAVHGKGKVPKRTGRAYGNYEADVSPYVVGYLVGRELEPEEVLETDRLHAGFHYEGEYVKVKPGSTPTEAWLAWSCDYALAYEQDTYGWQHPVAIVSWPTLDILQHDSEWNETGDRSKIFNDKASVDIRNLEWGPKMKAGLFGAYHIYPNYPDFMNNELAYNDYKDEEGRLRYGAYLKQFMEVHQGYPAVVAEFGLATGMGNAHDSPDGYHHGGMSEEEQGQGVVRMLKAIQREGYTGGIIFEWMDEWAKKTWTTEPYMIPYERHVFWHNALDPEQNYGLLAMDPVKSEEDMYSLEGSGPVKKVELSSDAAYLYIDVELERPVDWSKEELLIGLDTVDASRGEFMFREGLTTAPASGIEFLISLKGTDAAQLLVIPSYNATKGKQQTEASRMGIYERMEMLINKAGVRKDGSTYEARYEDRSRLRHGDWSSSLDMWSSTGNMVKLRLPWGRLQVTDPSSHQVLDDPAVVIPVERDQLVTSRTEGIRPYVVWLNKQDNKVLGHTTAGGVPEPYLWKGWTLPQYTERLKDSYPIIRDYFGTLK